MLGCLAFANRYAGDAYLDIMLTITNNKIFLIIFLYPSFVFLWYLVINYMNNDYSYLLRMNNRRDYLFKIIKQLILATTLFFLQYIVIQMIFINITKHTPFLISNNFGYDTNDFILLLVCLGRTFLNLLILGLFSFLLLMEDYNKEFSSSIIFLVLIITFFSDRFYATKYSLINIFNLGFQVYGYDLCNNIYYLISSSIFFFLTLSLILMFTINKKYQKIDLGIDV